jgi:para-nitrobenzyl esterase
MPMPASTAPAVARAPALEPGPGTGRRRPRFTALAAALLLPAVGAAATPPAPVASPSRATVTIPQGTLLGTLENGLQVFRGIPYAGAPVGEWRWRPPQPAPRWRGVRDASAFGPVCPQPLGAEAAPDGLAARPMSEDCLHLAIWTPDTRAAARLPVMLWLLPGGFTRGDYGMSRYDGRALAKRGVVLVSFNYRLGLFGEFAHPALAGAHPDEPRANYHLMDQVAAMRWVRANIAAFGGDPANVTIFGMSAGGMSVNYQMASPASVGLFDKAISQSSALRMSHDRALSEDVRGIPSLEAEGIGHARALGIDGADPAAARALRALPMAQLLDYQQHHPIGAAGGLNPVIDGRVLVQPVGMAFRAGRQHPVPYITGATSWEGSLVQGGAKSLPPVLQVLNLTRAQVDPVYRERDEGVLAWKVYSDFFLASQRYLAAAHARLGPPTWVYRFSRVLDQHQGDYYGAAHGAETRYVFGTLDALPRVAGPDRPGDLGWRVDDDDRAYADLVAGYWVQFARTGNPNGDGLPGWPARTPGNDLLLEFGQQAPQVRRDFMAPRWRFFEAHFDAGQL